MVDKMATMVCIVKHNVESITACNSALNGRQDEGENGLTDGWKDADHKLSRFCFIHVTAQSQLRLQFVATCKILL